MNQIGYSIVHCSESNSSLISEVIPLIANDHVELRKWYIFMDLRLSQECSNLLLSSNEIEPLLKGGQIKVPSQAQSIEDFFDDPFCLLPSFLVQRDGGSN